MIKFGFIIAKIRSKFAKSPKSYEIMNKYYRKGGASIGQGCIICSSLDRCEKELLFFGDNVIVSTDVLFVTHDVSISMFSGKRGSLFGKITIGNNVFIGERSTLLYGVTLADSIIVGAGSVVTKSFLEPGVIIAGNPARIIGKIDSYLAKYNDKSMLVKEMTEAIKGSNSKLIQR